MAKDKKKEINKATKDGVISKEESKELKSAGVSKDRIKNNKAQAEAVNNVGKKFGTKDFKALQDSGLSNNKILKVGASSEKVTGKASNKLSGLNPGIKLPSRASADMSGRQQGGSVEAFSRYNKGMDALGVRTELTKSLDGLGKNYLQWQGTDAKGRPQALGGYKVPKNLRKADQNNPLGISQKAMKRGTFTGYDGSGTLFGRDGSSVLGNDGKMKNKPATWMPGKSGNGTGGGKNKGKGGMKGTGMYSYGDYGDSGESSTGSGVFGGTGTETYGSPTFRRKRSRAQQSGSFAQGPSRLGINLQRQSGLNIMRA